MRFEKEDTLLTPPEAAFIERIGSNPALGEIKRKVQAATLDWAIGALPVSQVKAFQGREAGYAFLRCFATLDTWQPEDGEVIKAQFSEHELQLIKGLAKIAVAVARESACNIDADLDDTKKFVEGLIPDLVVLGESDQAMLKNDLFEGELEKLATGNALIAAIDNHSNQN